MEHVLPHGVAIAGGEDPEGLRAQRDGGAVGVGVVEAKAAAEDVPVGLHFGESAGDAGVTHVAACELGLAIADDAEGAGLDDALLEVASLRGAEEARLVVVGVGREERVAGGQVEQGLVALELLVPEQAEGRVAGAIALDDLGGALAEDHALLLDAVALGDQGAVGAEGVVVLAEAGVDDQQVVLQAGDGDAQLDHGLLDLEDAFLVARIELDPALLGLDGGFQGLLDDGAGEIDAVDGGLGDVCGGGGGGLGRGQDIATGGDACDDGVGDGLVRGLLGVLQGLLGEFLDLVHHLADGLGVREDLVLDGEGEAGVMGLLGTREERLELEGGDGDFLAGTLGVAPGGSNP